LIASNQVRGDRGPRLYDWALIETATADHSLLARRSLHPGEKGDLELAYFLCCSPRPVTLPELVAVAGARWQWKTASLRRITRRCCSTNRPRELWYGNPLPPLHGAASILRQIASKMGSLMQLEHKRIVVVGGALGCGAAAVRAFVAEGASVAVLDIRDPEGESAVSDANAKGPGRALYLHCDAAVRTSVKEAFASAAKGLDGIDALLMPAGVNLHCAAESIDDDEWNRLIDNNLRSTFVTNQEIFPYLVENGGGRILNFGSGAAFRPYQFAAHYAASKGAVVAWTRSIAYAWGKHGITANVVNPSMSGTQMYEQAHGSKDDVDDFAEHLAELFPGGFPLGARRFPPTDEKLRPDYGNADTDLGPVLVFLVGDGARFITAQVIPVDGGGTPVR
jgi:NAD(P)-dependent dehydrogenase (short-subunit alcohol dehydrogenase family)